MKTYTVEFESMPGSELMFGKKVNTPKDKGETHEQHEKRTWKEKVHNDDGNVFIQPFALKNALESAGKWLSMKIPGEGKKTFTDRFRKGVLVTDKMFINAKLDDIEPCVLFVPGPGRRGAGTRVEKIFPRVAKWKTTATLHVIDDKIDEEVLMDHLECVGQFIGFGSMRVENGGINGRFTVSNLKVAK